MHRVALIAALALLVAAVPANAGPPEMGTPHGTLRGTLNAVSDSVAPVGLCGSREVTLAATQNTDGSKFFDAAVATYDCGGTLTSLHDGCADLPNAPDDGCSALTALQINEDRTAGSAEVTGMPLYDVTNGFDNAPQVSTFDADVAWAGFGKLQTQMFHYSLGTKNPYNAVIINIDHERCRNAGLSGTISEDGGANYLDGATTTGQLCEQIPGSTFLFVFPFK
jgi:hypothetical protein